jgi:hypothetical protein
LHETVKREGKDFLRSGNFGYGMPKCSKQGEVMKNLKNKGIIAAGSSAGLCLMVSMAFANPAMLPEHPGHPMKPLKSPVTGQSLANDPGQSPGTGQKALQAATAEGRKDRKSEMQDIQKEKIEEREQPSEKSQNTQ